MKGKVVKSCNGFLLQDLSNKQGITLVALIITIIVMLILAGVTIATAIGEDGIIQKAQFAVKEYERVIIQEKTIESYVYTRTASLNIMGGYIDIEKTGIAIYKNLYDSGFEVLAYDEVEDENGDTVRTARLTSNKSQIAVIVEGKHGIYEGTVKGHGLDGDFIPVKKEDLVIPEPEEPVMPEDPEPVPPVDPEPVPPVDPEPVPPVDPEPVPPLSSKSILYTDGEIGVLIGESEIAFLATKNNNTGVYDMTWFFPVGKFEKDGIVYEKALLKSMYNLDGSFKEYGLYGYLEDEKVVLVEQEKQLTQKITIEDYYEGMEGTVIYSTTADIFDASALNATTGMFIKNETFYAGVIVDNFILTSKDMGGTKAQIVEGKEIDVVMYETGEKIKINLTGKDVIVSETDGMLLGYYEGEQIRLLMLNAGEDGTYMEWENFPLSDTVVFEEYYTFNN